jgi:glycosyltransferase involved in cell wall biosynthesis
LEIDVRRSDGGRGAEVPEHGSVAIVHDYLSQCGGAERVVLELARALPGAPIYTSFYAPECTYAEFRDLDVVTSDLQERIHPEHFRSAALRYPGAFRRFDLRGFDTVVVSSSAFAHHVAHGRTFVYCHTPPRFLYDSAAYTGAAAAALRVAIPGLSLLRRADRRAARRAVSHAANSAVTAGRLRRLYGVQARVIHPPLHVEHLPAVPPPMPSRPRALVIARLLPYKRVDVAVQACRQAGIPLTVVGEGPQEGALRALAGADAVFLGRLADADLRELFADHSVVVVPGCEDFGYLPVEASFAGRPVVARAAGGALETVHRDTGILVDGDDVDGWAAALHAVHEREWDPAALRAATEPFGAAHFRSALYTWLALSFSTQ